jgi:hypothetical protein
MCQFAVPQADHQRNESLPLFVVHYNYLFSIPLLTAIWHHMLNQPPESVSVPAWESCLLLTIAITVV